MTKKAEKRPGTQGGNGTDTGLATVLAPLVAGMTATRASLLHWVQGRGVVALQEVFAAEAAVASALDAIQIHGGYGYATETGIERALRDAVGGRIYSGTSEVLRNIISHELGL